MFLSEITLLSGEGHDVITIYLMGLYNLLSRVLHSVSYDRDCLQEEKKKECNINGVNESDRVITEDGCREEGKMVK